MPQWITVLFTTDIGLLSMAVIAFILVMATYLFFFVRRHVREDSLAHEQQHQKLPQ